MRKDHFTKEALAAAKALVDLKYSENEDDQLRFSEAYDFARCQRSDGSFYGTGGQCRIGKESGEAPARSAKEAGMEVVNSMGRSPSEMRKEALATGTTQVRGGLTVTPEGKFVIKGRTVTLNDAIIAGGKENKGKLDRAAAMEELAKAQRDAGEKLSPKDRIDMDKKGLDKLMANSPTAQRKLKEAREAKAARAKSQEG
jgi:hypothetical protein